MNHPSPGADTPRYPYRVVLSSRTGCHYNARMDASNGRESVQIGDGLLNIVLGDKTITVDPVAWVRWHQDWRPPEGASPWAMHDEARGKLKYENDVEINATQADAFLHGILAWFAGLKKKQRATLGLPSSIGSPPSE